MFKRTNVLLVAGVLVLLICAGLRYVPNTYKGHLEARLSRRLGYPVHLGHVRLTLLQGVGLRILGFKILGENGDPIVFRARGVSAGPKLLPLLRGQILLGRVTLDGPYARLWLDADGDLHLWKQTHEPEVTLHDVRRSPMGFSLNELVVKDGVVEFKNERDGPVSTSFQARGVNAIVRFTSTKGSSFVKVSAEVRGDFGVCPLRAIALFVTANVEPESGRMDGRLRCVGADAKQFWKYCRRWVQFHDLHLQFDRPSRMPSSATRDPAAFDCRFRGRLEELRRFLKVLD